MPGAEGGTLVTVLYQTLKFVCITAHGIKSELVTTRDMRNPVHVKQLVRETEKVKISCAIHKAGWNSKHGGSQPQS